jgi:hypothetical protein
MHTTQFIKLVSVAGWLWVSQGNLVRSEQVGLIAQSSTPCTVSSLTAGDLLPSSSPVTALTGTISIAITCPSGVGGTLQLSLQPTPISVVNNGGAKMGFVSKSGTLTVANTATSTGTIEVVIPAATGIRTGTGSIQVDINALNSKLLKSANDYKLVVTADFN